MVGHILWSFAQTPTQGERRWRRSSGGDRRHLGPGRSGGVGARQGGLAGVWSARRSGAERPAKKAGSGSPGQADPFLADGRGGSQPGAREGASWTCFINNAGGVFSAGAPTVDGSGKPSFALNVAAPHVLTEELLDVLSAKVAGEPWCRKARTALPPGSSRWWARRRPAACSASVHQLSVLLTLTQVQQQVWRSAASRDVVAAHRHRSTTRFGPHHDGLHPFTTIGPFFAKLFRFGIATSRRQWQFVKVGFHANVGRRLYYHSRGEVRPKPEAGARAGVPAGRVAHGQREATVVVPGVTNRRRQSARVKRGVQPRSPRE